MTTVATTTLTVVARPTPAAPPVARSPAAQAMKAIVTPKTAPLRSEK
jgi:hypothetical protein